MLVEFEVDFTNGNSFCRSLLKLHFLRGGAIQKNIFSLDITYNILFD